MLQTSEFEYYYWGGWDLLFFTLSFLVQSYRNVSNYIKYFMVVKSKQEFLL